MTQKIFYKNDTRGYANYGWLETNYSFSFSNYFDRNRMNFGVLRVLNDDKIAPSMGFGTHPHDNMEIITIILEGELTHKDSMGNTATIKKGEIQVMSAGTGITHSEFNNHNNKWLKLLQIWIFPNKKNVSPRYDELKIKDLAVKNKLFQLISPNANEQGGVWIHQNAWFFMGDFDSNTSETYNLQNNENGVYVFLIEGQIEIENQILNKRDAIGIWDSSNLKIQALQDSHFLIIEVPMMG